MEVTNSELALSFLIFLQKNVIKCHAWLFLFCEIRNHISKDYTRILKTGLTRK
jgi:hypothetical protein